MTFAPDTLRALGAYWTAHGGVNLGIVGDVAHQAKGTSYHLGKSDLRAGAYSASLPRDVAGLSEAASAIDLGRLSGTLKGLQDFSVWLVEECERHAPGTSDIREVIYSPNGSLPIHRWSEPDQEVYTGPGNGDASHLWHTHVSYYRDSELREKVPAFRAYFEGTDEEMDATRYKPVAVCAVKAGGSLYADPDRKTLISSNFGGGPTIQLYAMPVVPVVNGKAELAPIRIDRLSGPAEDLYIGYVRADLISDIRLIDAPPVQTVTISGQGIAVGDIT